MIMPRGQPLLLPANPVFIAASLVFALAINLLPLGRAAWRPDLLVLLLVFWGVHQPQKLGFWVAFVLGLCMDVHQSALLGQHALAYTVALYGVTFLQRRLLWVGVFSQALLVLPLVIVPHALELALRMLAGGLFPGWGALLAPLLEAALWPLASWVLLAPQRRPPSRDENRPL